MSKMDIAEKRFPQDGREGGEREAELECALDHGFFYRRSTDNASGDRFPPAMTFIQTPPTLGNTFEDDHLLKSYLERKVPADARAPGIR